MSIERIHESLTRKFDEHRVVFWYDAAGEFKETVDDLQLTATQVIRLDRVGAFSAKLTIETGDDNEKLLVYAPHECPNPNDDVLLDVFLYSGHFSADTSEMVRDELGLQLPEIREFIKPRLQFFSEARKRELKGYIEGPEEEEVLALKMMRVLFDARGSTPTELVLALCKLKAECSDGEPKAVSDLKRFQLDTLFWNTVQRDFGYVAERPTVEALLYSLVATDIASKLGAATPAPLKSLVADHNHKVSNASVLMSTWRDSDRFRHSYETLLRRASEELRLEAHLRSISTALLMQVQTTEVVEVLLLERCRDILSGALSQSEREEAESIVLSRRNSYWSESKPMFEAAYNAMFAALGLAKLKEEYPNGFIASALKSFAALYLTELYRFDEEYRNYYRFQGSEGVAGTLVPVTARVEELYNEWFLPTLASAWAPFVKNNLLGDWNIPGMVNQHDFYKRVVEPLLSASSAPRVAVIVSDALRYEAARSLTVLLNKRDNFKAEIASMLSVLPSHTALGMAALLPHNSIDYDGSGVALVDGLNAEGLKNRNQILERHGGIALSAKDVKTLPREELRAQIGERSIVYIYHNRIDETGDNQTSEREVFEAVSQTLEELEAIVAKTLNNLNCSVAVITADHGFIFTNGELLSTEHSEVEIHTGTALIEKKRYIVGTKLDMVGACWKTTTKITAATTTEYDVVVPRGINRFHFKGGARYFHGGAMPQEVLVPAITVRKARDKAVEKTRTTKVDVALLASTDRIAAPRQSFRFIQTELATDKRLPRLVTVGFYEDTGSDLIPISDVHRLTFDATEENQSHREQTVTFVFKSVRYEPSKNYVLRIVDQENELELSRHRFQVKILIADEFN